LQFKLLFFPFIFVFFQIFTIILYLLLLHVLTEEDFFLAKVPQPFARVRFVKPPFSRLGLWLRPQTRTVPHSTNGTGPRGRHAPFCGQNARHRWHKSKKNIKDLFLY
jgi:hypothetical protein